MIGRSLKTLSDVVDWNLCTGCGACVPACKRGGVRMVHVESEGYRPVFDDPACKDCTECLKVCPGARLDGALETGSLPTQTHADHEFGPTLEIWEGWASNPDVRFRGSSGGVLSALSLYCLEAGGFTGVMHAGMDEETPWKNRNYISRDREDISKRAGSRYAPSSPCAALADVEKTGRNEHLVFIGKPCDAAAVGTLRREHESVRAHVGLVLTFFCAGTPSTRGTLDLLDHLGVERSQVHTLHYRGEGWPGKFRVATAERREQASLSYKESWSRLTSYRPLRCNLCPDGLGRVADISCGDAWDKYEEDGDPGRSLILVRTERGREILARAHRAGYVTLERVGADNVLRAQPSLLGRRRALFGRLAAFRLLGVPVPDYKGFSLFRSWCGIGPKEQFKSVAGTARRIVQRGWLRPRERRRALSSGEARTNA